MLLDRKLTIINRLLNVAAEAVSYFIDSMQHMLNLHLAIYIFYHHLSTFLKLDEVGASDIDFLLFYLCSKFFCRKMRTDLWLKLRWVCLPSFCEIFVCAGNNRWISLETTRGAYYFLVYVWYETSKSTSDTLPYCPLQLDMYFTNTSLWAAAARNVIPAECDWL